MKVRVMSLYEAVHHSYKELDKRTAIVSITCPDDKLPNFKLDNKQILGILELHFNDVERDYPECVAPKKEDFTGLKDFIDSKKDSVDEIIVHCHAGISRSSACATAICRYLGIDDSFIWDSSSYMPNPLVFKLGLEELGVDLNSIDIKGLYERNTIAHECLPYSEEVESMFSKKVNDNGETIYSLKL